MLISCEQTRKRKACRTRLNGCPVSQSESRFPRLAVVGETIQEYYYNYSPRTQEMGMKTKTTKVQGVLVSLAFVATALLLSGCGTIGNRAAQAPSVQQQAVEARYQAEIRRLQTEAAIAATDKDDDHLAEALSAMPELGAVGWSNWKPVLHEGKPVMYTNADGKEVPLMQMEAIGKSNSMRELEGVDYVAFTLGGVPIDPATGKLYTDKLVGLYVTLRNGGAKTGLDSDLAKTWAGKTAAEKQAGALAAAEYLKTKINGRVAVIDALGNKVEGVLKAVGTATPIGAGLAAVKAVVATDGGEVTGTAVEPMRE
jgi:uncharacterized protein YceK